MSILVVTAVSFSLLAGPPSFRGGMRVDSKYVSGRTLSVPELDFSADAPGDSWEWFSRGANSDRPAYIAYDAAEDTPFIIQVMEPHDAAPDASFMDNFLDTARQRFSQGGAGLEDARWERSDVPRPGSCRYSWVMRINDSASSITGYIVPGSRYYNVHYVTKGEPRNAEFDRFVRSFRTGQPARKDQLTGTTMLYTALAVLGLGGVAAALIWRRRKRPAQAAKSTRA